MINIVFNCLGFRRNNACINILRTLEQISTELCRMTCNVVVIIGLNVYSLIPFSNGSSSVVNSQSRMAKL